MDPLLLPELERGSTPLLISVPHAGTSVPAEIAGRFTGQARALPDTDWFVDRLYGFATSCGAGLLVAGASRYVVDANRPPDGRPLYDATETRLTTHLVPLTTFAGEPVYLHGREPDAAEVHARIEQYWRPYHQRLQAELERLRIEHGHALLLDAHSIRSHLPLLFEGELPVFNLGSNSGASAARSLIERADGTLRRSRYSNVLDGRFRGGYITRQYGKPETDVHVLQLELAQSCYMDEENYIWIDSRAAVLQQVLRRLIDQLLDWRP